MWLPWNRRRKFEAEYRRMVATQAGYVAARPHLRRMVRLTGKAYAEGLGRLEDKDWGDLMRWGGFYIADYDEYRTETAKAGNLGGT